MTRPITQAQIQTGYGDALGASPTCDWVKGFPTLMLETAQGRQFIDINPNDPEEILAGIHSAL